MRRFLLMLLALMLVGIAPISAAQDMAHKKDGSKYKIFVQDVRMVGLDPQYAQIYSSFISEAIQELNMFEVVTSQDLQELIDYEQVKEVLACDNVSCLAEIGGVAVADLMLTCNISKFPDNISMALNLSSVESLKKIKTSTEMLLGDNLFKINQLLPIQTKLLFSDYLTPVQNMEFEMEIARIKTQENNRAVSKKRKQKKASKAQLSPRLKGERNAAIALGVIGGAAIIGGAIISGKATHDYSNDLYYPAPYNFSDANEFVAAVKRNNKVAVSGIVTWATGSALAVTSLALGIDFALKSKAPKVVAIPTFSQDGAHLTLSYRW